ncbi:MAG TPA: ribbon-helix-helix protein, CopG family [Gemmatimonadales bacterium]
MNKRPFQIYLDDRDRALLRDLAGRLGLSQAEIVRAAVRRWGQELSGTDPLLGLIGSMDDPALPTDLSTRHDDYAVEPAPVRRVAERPSPKRKR